MNNKKTNIIFMGTPDFAVPSLRSLLNNGDVHLLAVVTQPDRPKGRKKVLTAPPVKEEAIKHGLKVLQPEKIREHVQMISDLQPDLIVTAAYGQILPASLLDIPPLGCINVHASLLPKYRGGAPIQYALLRGEEKTGVTIMYMAEGLDTGDMISKVEIPIKKEDDAGTLFDTLSQAGSVLLQETLPKLIANEITAEKQNDEAATYAKTLKREDEKIDWEKGNVDIYNHIRALSPWPISFTLYEGKVLKMGASVHPEDAPACSNEHAKPGTILQFEDKGMEVKTGDGSIWITHIQPAGKKMLPVEQYMRGKKLEIGTILGGTDETAAK
ncbi:methionyl-tRNA formyltransferase [Longirhabdus pacifica]|uniref:methionyl-tRNA formyltransferase n=1 Tax=Longirhabdus pacifica TaxID=2305227 RepID=UPI001008D0F3|nr:methionyl-tRNA formyltransferase [Longirhabdus pacifica]